MAAQPSYELTLKVSFQGELPDAILKLLSEIENKEAAAKAPEASKAPAATDSYEVLLDSDSSDEDAHMDDAAAGSEDDSDSIVHARAYWNSRKDANERLGIDEVKTEKEPQAGAFTTTSSNNIIGASEHGTSNSVKSVESHLSNPFRIRNFDTEESRDSSSHSQSQNQNSTARIRGASIGIPSSINNTALRDLRDRTFRAAEYQGRPVCCQSPSGPWIQLCDPTTPGEPQIIPESLVVAVDGALKKTDGRKTASAIFYHPANKKNHSDTVPGKQTVERAKLYAAYLAVLCAEEIQVRKVGPTANLRRVVIKSDHLPVIEGITHNVYRWKAHGFRSKPSKPRIPNADLWEALDNAINALNQNGVRVQFWLVDSVQNEWASFLAQCSLEGKDAQSTMKQWPEDLEKDWVL